MKQHQFSIQKRIKSFGFAFNGLKISLLEEHNARLHFIAAICAVIAGFYFAISSLEWIAVVLVIGFVIALEIVNSAIENIADFISPEKHDAIKTIKDLSAAAVLVGASTALIVGLIIFLPKVFALM